MQRHDRGDRKKRQLFGREKIDYNLYRISGTRPNINQQLQLREFLYQRAQDFCMRNGQGAQLLDGVSGKNPKGEGVKAIVVFRCVGIMKGPENTFIDNSPEADAARAEAARIAREKAEEEARQDERKCIKRSPGSGKSMRIFWNWGRIFPEQSCQEIL